MATLSAESLAQLASLGMTLAIRLVEQRSNRSIQAMNDDHILKAIADIRIRPVDELIAEGRQQTQTQQTQQIIDNTAELRKE